MYMLTTMKQLKNVRNLQKLINTPPRSDAFALQRQFHNTFKSVSTEILQNLNKENITTAVDANSDTHSSFGIPF